MLVHPEVEKAVKSYHPDLVVRFNPKWTHDTNRFYVCQCIRYMREVDERIGLFEEFVWEYPVLGVDQAAIVDRRWFEALDENRWDHNRVDPLDMVKAESARKRKMIQEHTQGWAKDEGWWHFKRWMDQHNFGSYSKKDPTRVTKTRQDKTGRDNLL